VPYEWESGAFCPEQDVKMFSGYDPHYVMSVRTKNLMRGLSGSCSHGVKLREIGFSKKDESLVRRYWKVRLCRSSLKRFGQKWAYAFLAYQKMIPPGDRHVVSSVMNSLNANLCESCFIGNLKQLSNNALKQVLDHSVFEFRWLLDLRVLGGFDTELNRGDPTLSYPKDFGAKREGSEVIFPYIDEVISNIETRNVLFGFKEFVSFRDAWSTGGSSVRGTSKKIVFQGRRKKDVQSVKVKTKWFAMCHLTDDEIWDSCVSEGINVKVKPFVKMDEPAALRTVQGYDTYSVIRCNYIMQGIKDFNGHKRWTTLGMTGEERLRAYRDILDPHYWKLCTDQSSFDTHQCKNWIKYAVKSLFAHICHDSQHEDIKKICDIEFNSLDRVYLHYDGNELKWENGILSGYSFTALLDSILNAAQSKYVADKLNYRIVHSLFTGDDCIMLLNDKPDADAVAAVYNSLGLSVNASKTWVGRRNTEFLHELYMGDMVMGFPARGFRALLWRKPTFGSGTPGRVNEVKSFASVCLMAVRRGLYNVAEVMSRKFKQYGFHHDIKNYAAKFQAWWVTPCVHGGFGAGDHGRMSMIAETLYSKKFRLLPIQVGFAKGKEKQVYRTAVRNRAMGLVPFPGVKSKVYFASFKGDGQMPSSLISGGAMGAQPRVDWRLGDLKNYSDAYYRKLRLEWKIRSGHEINGTDLPTNWFSREGMDCDKTYREYRRLLDLNINLERSITTGLSFIRERRYCNQLWVGLCAAYVMRRNYFLEWFSLPSQGVVNLEKIKRLILSTVYSYSTHIRDFVRILV
jgi:hypothetical protein